MVADGTGGASFGDPVTEIVTESPSFARVARLDTLGPPSAP